MRNVIPTPLLAVIGVLQALGTSTMAAPRGQASIDWDRTTLTLVAQGGGYGRIVRLQSGELLCTYQRRGQSCIKRSRDEGQRWGPEQVVTRYAHGIAANPELLQRSNGDLWLLYNERPRRKGKPYAIMLVVSRDAGRTWSEPRRLFTAGTSSENGCWEPVALEYPDGEVQVFFANEALYTESNEQEISMISSHDFTTVHPVSFRAGARDGMPVPCLLRDGKTVVMAIEDSGLHGKMKPVILRSPVDRRWKQGVIDAGSARRQRALETPLARSIYAGAPYLRQMPSGPTVLSVQSDDGRGEPQMVVYVGDHEGRQFTNRSVPFPLGADESGLWNSLFVKNEDTVTAITGARINGIRGLWTIDGSLRARPK